MQIFHSKAERIRYLGFDDLWPITLGVPVIGLLSNTIYGGFDPSLSGSQMMATYTWSVVYTSIYWFLGRLTVIFLRKTYPRPADNVRRIALTVALLAVVVVAVKLTVGWLLTYTFGDTLQVPWYFELAAAYTFMILVLGAYEWVYNFTRYRQSELERERLARENVQTQLGVLRQQMNPHFLFNSLNTLATIIPEDTRQATKFTQRLAATYRRILEYRDRETVTLREELGCLEDYLFLLQTRFEDKLRITVEYAPGETAERLHNYRIVPLAGQLLVENAVKHNVVSADYPLTVTIHIDADRFTVRNNLTPRATAVASTGWGQDNLHRRYAALTDRSLLIERAEGRYTVSLPLLAPVASPTKSTLPA